MNKFIKATSLISNHYKDTIKINLSPPYGYRSRVSLAIEIVFILCMIHQEIFSI